MVRFSHGVAAVSLLLLLFSSALANGSDRDDGLCDPQEETQTEQFAILWKEEPYDVDDFFKDKDIKLEWSADWDWDEENIWSVYEAKTVKAANGIMRDIQRVIDGEDVEDDSEYGEGNPMSDPDVVEALKAHVAGVYGTCLRQLTASKPAAVPSECSGTPPEPVCPNTGLWGLNRINAPPVWRALPGVVNSAPSESVMVIDSGVRRTHQDLAVNLVDRLTVEGYGGSIRRLSDTTTPSRAPAEVLADPAFFLNHGTHVSGTVFGAWDSQSDNGRTTAAGVVGRALGGSCGCAVPFLNPETGQIEDVLNDLCLITCVGYAASQGVRVINLSLGSYQRPSQANRPDAWRSALVNYCNTGGLVVIAAGNGERAFRGAPFRGTNIIRPGSNFYPAAYAADLAASQPTCIINVANLQIDGVLSPDSNFGAFVQVAAPGTNILSSVASSNTDVGLLSGTSMAAPHVAGMATLLFNEFPGASQAEVYRCIVSTATRPVTANPLVPGQSILNGLVDLEAAFECMRGRAECPTRRLPPCVDPRSGQAVTSCDTDRFCLNIRSRRFVCQYSYRPDGFLCRSRNTTIVRTSSLDLDGVELVRLSAEELTTMGLEAEPSVQLLSEGEGEEEVAASVLGGIEVQQGTRRTKTRRTKRKVVTCGQCRNRMCETVTGALCKAARQQVVVRAK